MRTWSASKDPSLIEGPPAAAVGSIGLGWLSSAGNRRASGEQICSHLRLAHRQGRRCACACGGRRCASPAPLIAVAAPTAEPFHKSRRKSLDFRVRSTRKAPPIGAAAARPADGQREWCVVCAILAQENAARGGSWRGRRLARMLHLGWRLEQVYHDRQWIVWLRPCTVSDRFCSARLESCLQSFARRGRRSMVCFIV
jgi:hypothetical protein